jgi:excisionase family DNA binding protein
MPDPLLMTRSEVAHQLGISVRTVDRMIRGGEFETVWVGHRRRVPEWSFLAYLARIGAASAAEGGS